MPPQPKCSRPACPNKAPAGYHGYCMKHASWAGVSHPLADGDEARKLIAHHRAAGHSLTSIQHHTGIGIATLIGVENGTRDHVRESTMSRLRNLDADPTTVPAWPLTRRLQALRAAGTPSAELVAGTGLNQDTIWRLSAGRAKRASRRVDDAIRSYYAAHEADPVRPADPKVAKRRWPLPMEWWDIDDPQERRGLLTTAQLSDHVPLTDDIVDAAQWLVDDYGARREVASEGIGLSRPTLGHILDGKRDQITRETAHRVTYMASQTGWAPGRTQEVAA